MRVEFYVLPTQDNADRLLAACRLAVKAWRSNWHTAIRVANAHDAETLNQQLWTFRPDSFIPHDLISENPSAPVLIATTETLPNLQGLLINLQPEPYPEHSHFSRIIEIVNQTPEVLQQCRKNFVHYRQLNLNPQRVEL